MDAQTEPNPICSICKNKLSPSHQNWEGSGKYWCSICGKTVFTQPRIIEPKEDLGLQSECGSVNELIEIDQRGS